MPELSLAGLLGKRFIERRDVIAVQNPDGTYRPEERPFKMKDLEDHLAGTRSYGHYVLSPESTVRLFCFDVDVVKDKRDVFRGEDTPERRELIATVRTITECLTHYATHRFPGVETALVYSGNKGMHGYVFLPPGTPAADARLAAIEVLETFSTNAPFQRVRGDHFWQHSIMTDVEIELFPKQDKIEAGHYGNLLRLPLGVNRKSKQEGFFVNPNYPFELLVADDPVRALTSGDPWAAPAAKGD